MMRLRLSRLDVELVVAPEIGRGRRIELDDSVMPASLSS